MTIKQKTIMMIGGGIQEVKAVEIAQSSGYKVIVTDRNEDAPCFAYEEHLEERLIILQAFLLPMKNLLTLN